VIPVTVTNAAGTTSTEAVTLHYPAVFAASWTSTTGNTTAVIALPGMLVAPAPVLQVQSREAATCTLSINASACARGGYATEALWRPASMSVRSAVTFDIAASAQVDGVTTLIPLSTLVVSGGSGCAGALVATCIDSKGITAETAWQGAPLIQLAAWRLAWRNSGLGMDTNDDAARVVVVPTELPQFNASFQLNTTSAMTSTMNFSATPALSCVAVLTLAALGRPGADVALDRLPPRDVISTVSGELVALSPFGAVVQYHGLSAASVGFGVELAVWAECTWTPTGEGMRLPPLYAVSLPLQLAWGDDADRPSIVVLGYTPHPFTVCLTLLVFAPAPPTTAQCSFRLVNATWSSASLVADSWSVAVDPRASPGALATVAGNATLQAPPGTGAYIQAVCVAWGQEVASPPLHLTTATLEVRTLSRLPTWFVASDVNSPAPVEPDLTVIVQQRENAVAVADTTCALTTLTDGVVLSLVDAASSSTGSLLSIPAHPTSGVIAVPPFVVQTATDTPSIQLRLTCRRDSGDAPEALTFVVPGVQLHATLCAPPVSTSLVGMTLPTFAVGVDTSFYGTTTEPCHTPPPSAAVHRLPPIVCTITYDAAASSEHVANSTVYLVGAVAAMEATTHLATFPSFSVAALQGEEYTFELQCAVGSLTIAPAHRFSVTLNGCPPGKEAVSVACVPCGKGQFSLGGTGATCRGCPPVGAVCEDGILKLLSHYFRPAAQAGQPIGPTTELHACYNDEACVLDYSNNTVEYSCAAGYGGPLCGVCDSEGGYARFGEACAQCWAPGAAIVVLIVLGIILLALLTRVALHSSNTRSDASIVLRIMLSFLQAAGSLRVFRAGSTKAYASVMDWTDAVSASPLSTGVLQCSMRLPYLSTYVGTVLMPVLVSIAVIAIFLVVTVARAVQCGGARWWCGCNTSALRTTVSRWWATKRHISSLLFVLFLTYMPIVSASLRALDCIDPVAGVRYLRSDLSVECGVREHIAARALAYTVLIVVGIGFPAGLTWLLGATPNEQLADPAFHATWGFLFDGYRAPARVLVSGTGTKGAEGAAGVLASGVAKASAADAVLDAGAAKVRRPTGRASVTAGAMAALRASHRRLSLLPDALAQTWVASGDSRVWWEGVVLVRKAGVVLLAVLVTNPYQQCVGATLWIAGAAVLQGWYAPYAKRWHNALEMTSLVATFLTAVVSIMLLQFNVGVTAADKHTASQMTTIEWAVTVTLVLINLGTFLLFAAVWLRLQYRRVRTILRRSSTVPFMVARVAAWSQRRSGTAKTLAEPTVGGRVAVARKSITTASSEAVTTTMNPLRVDAKSAGGSRVGSPSVRRLSASLLSPPATGGVSASVPETLGSLPGPASGSEGTGAARAARPSHHRLSNMYRYAPVRPATADAVDSSGGAESVMLVSPLGVTPVRRAGNQRSIKE